MGSPRKRGSIPRSDAAAMSLAIRLVERTPEEWAELYDDLISIEDLPPNYSGYKEWDALTPEQRISLHLQQETFDTEFNRMKVGK